MNFLDMFSGLDGMIGDPMVYGLLTLMFFGGFVFLQNTRLDAKLLGLVGGFILAMAFIPLLKLIFALFFSGFLYLAFVKFTNK